GCLLPRPAGGYAFAAPALRQVAAERLPRALRVVFTRRAANAPRLGAVFATPTPTRPADSTDPAPLRRRIPTPTMATGATAQTPEINRPPGSRRLRTVASAGDVPPSGAATASVSANNVGGRWLSGGSRTPTRAVPGQSAGQRALTGADAPPGGLRAVA
ncbi:hypothetical protein JNW91_30975, partial [Micromonospora sp. STR1_7]|nr:hypothetical protein [Micromonospora parastrephiae]